MTNQTKQNKQTKQTKQAVPDHDGIHPGARGRDQVRPDRGEGARATSEIYRGGGSKGKRHGAQRHTPAHPHTHTHNTNAQTTQRTNTNTQFTPLYAGVATVQPGTKPPVGGGYVSPLLLDTFPPLETPVLSANRTATVSADPAPAVVPLTTQVGISSSFAAQGVR